AQTFDVGADFQDGRFDIAAGHNRPIVLPGIAGAETVRQAGCNLRLGDDKSEGVKIRVALLNFSTLPDFARRLLVASLRDDPAANSIIARLTNPAVLVSSVTFLTTDLLCTLT